MSKTTVAVSKSIHLLVKQRSQETGLKITAIVDRALADFLAKKREKAA